MDERTAHFRQAIKALDEEIRNVQILFIQAYKKYERGQLRRDANEIISCSHLNEHVSNFAAVSTQVHVTLWKDNKLLMNKDRQYLVKLLRPEDRSDRCVLLLPTIERNVRLSRMEALLMTLDELALLANDKISKVGDMVLFSCIRYARLSCRRQIAERLFSPFDDQSEQAVVTRLKKMNEGVDDDDGDDLLTVSRDCRPILQHKLVSVESVR